MILEHYPEMTENEILKIAEEAFKKWNINYVSTVSYTHLTLPTNREV